MNQPASIAIAYGNGLRGVGTPLLLLLMLAMMVVPLPPLMLDALFTFNISLSLVILLVTVYALRPLDFATFPSVLLLATLLRLALNVATTRIVLLHGHTGPDAAGMVIQSFGDFVIGGNYTVGIVVFAVLVIINFVVVTRGAGRISEVSARFVLDAMPGKQMAVDADLGAGLINQDQARRRRQEIAQEADFYGAMDGASKFVRGDAIAGILIVFINIIGGLAIGVLQHHQPFEAAVRTYALLTIGDGLVAQIPSLVLSTATALMVTRVSESHDMGRQVYDQLFGSYRVLAAAAVIVGIMGLVPGMPNLAFLAFAALIAGAAYILAARERTKAAAPAEPQPETPERPALDIGWDDVTPVDAIGMEVGFKLIPLVDKGQGGELMNRIRGVRKKLTQELGFLIPAVHVRDNLALAPDAYRISLQGSVVGEAAIYPEKCLAINSSERARDIHGIKTRDPAFGLPAVWIDTIDKESAQAAGYTVVDATTVIATHMSQLIQNHAHELLSYEDVRQLLDRMAKSAPKLIEDLTPKVLSLAVIHKVLQNLLRERVPIRDMRTIAECLAEHAVKSQDSDALTVAVRIALGRTIVQQINGVEEELPVITLEPSLEHLLLGSLRAESGEAMIEPGLIEKLGMMLAESAKLQEAGGRASVLLVSPMLRPWLARLARHSVPGTSVLSYHEIPDSKRIRIVNVIGRPEDVSRIGQSARTANK